MSRSSPSSARVTVATDVLFALRAVAISASNSDVRWSFSVGSSFVLRCEPAAYSSLPTAMIVSSVSANGTLTEPRKILRTRGWSSAAAEYRLKYSRKCAFTASLRIEARAPGKRPDWKGGGVRRSFVVRALERRDARRDDNLGGAAGKDATIKCNRSICLSR